MKDSSFYGKVKQSKHREFGLANIIKKNNSPLIKDYFKNNLLNLDIKIINTGASSMTGGRIKILKKYVNERFMLTYGDGLCDVNIKKLLHFHKTNKSRN